MVAMTQMNKENPQSGFGSLRKTTFQLLAAMVIFISGLITGVCTTMFLIKDKVVWMGSAPTKPTASAITQEITDKFDLSDEQAKKVEDIFEEVVKSVNSMREDYAAQMEASQKNTIEQMKQVLSDQQFSAWYEDFTRRINHGPSHEPGGGPGPGPGPGFGPGPEPGFGPEPGMGDGPPPPPPGEEEHRFLSEDMERP